MKKKKITINTINFFTLDLTDAILPKTWPSDVPLILKLQTGQHEKDYDIIPVDEKWYESLLKFVDSQQYTTKDRTLPIGLNRKNMQIGAKIYDLEKNIVAQGKDKELHLEEIIQKKLELENKLIPLRNKFSGIKDKYLEDFNETQELLLTKYRPFTNPLLAYDVFCDIYILGGGSTYKDGSIASLGAYNSLIDFNTLKCTLDLFTKEELEVMKIASEELAYLTPIHSVINGQIKTQSEKILKPKIS